MDPSIIIGGECFFLIALSFVINGKIMAIRIQQDFCQGLIVLGPILSSLFYTVFHIISLITVFYCKHRWSVPMATADGIMLSM